MPRAAALSAFSLFLAPRKYDITALIPTPKPIAMALIKFWTGKTSESAVMAFSLIFATKKLSTIL